MKPLTLSMARAWLLGCTLGPVALLPFGEYLALEPWGGRLGHWCGWFALGSISAALCFMVWAVFKLVRGGPHVRPVLVLTCSVLFIASTFVGFRLAFSYRRVAFLQLAERSRPLIDAIKGYEVRHGRASADLSELVPEFLPTIPATGMAAYPEYKYWRRTDKDGETEWDGNPWILYLHTPLAGPNFDMFLYFPLQNYPKTGYGGSLERLGDWAYVHEQPGTAATTSTSAALPHALHRLLVDLLPVVAALDEDSEAIAVRPQEP